MNHINTVIYDFDDTLIATSPKYEYAQFRACIQLLEYAGIGARYKNDLLQRQEEIDDAIVEKEGFAQGYHEKAFAEFLEQICSEAGLCVPDEMRKEFCELARYPLNPKNYSPKDLLSGVRETLEFQIKNNTKLYLVTRGIESVQREKMCRTGIYDFFRKENTYVVNKNDKSEVFEKICKGEAKSKIAIVDDALKIINVGTELGLLGFFIPPKRGCRKREKDNLKIKNKHLTIPLESIIEVKNQYGRYSNAFERESANDLPDYIKQYL